MIQLKILIFFCESFDFYFINQTNMIKNSFLVKNTTSIDISSHCIAVYFSTSSNKLFYVSLILPDYNEILKHWIILHSVKLYQRNEKVYENILTMLYFR